MNLRPCRPKDALADTQALLQSACLSIQGFWQQLGCPRRQAVHNLPEVVQDSCPTGSFSLRTITGLPDVLQAQVLEFSGNATASSLSLASRDLHKGMWQSMEIWEARLASIGAPGNAGPAAELREQYRWHSCGIDALCRPGVHSGDAVAVLEHGRRVVKALVKEDAPFLDLISMNLADLIRWYDYTDESAHKAAQALFQEVIGKSYLFTAEHIRDLSSALDSACSLREMLVGDETELAATEEELYDNLAPYSCEELLSRIADSSNDSEDISEFPNCDDEACERVMELLRNLPEGL